MARGKVLAEVTPGPNFFPIDVAADGKGTLYVVDTNNFRILQFIDKAVKDLPDLPAE